MFEYHIGRLSRLFALVAAVAVVALVVLVVYDVAMRYLFSQGSVALQELEWHLFDTVFLLGMAYTLMHRKHVRVDIFYERFSPQTRALIDVFGTMILIVPFSFLMLLYGYDMALQSFLQNEISPDPGGLGARWIIKGVLVAGFALLVLQAFAEIIKGYMRIEQKRIFWLIALFIVLAGALIFAGWWYRLAYPIDPVYLLFITVFAGLMAGVPVAFVFGASAMLFATIDDSLGIGVLEMLPYRTYGMMSNTTLMAVPLFIFMGLILERTKSAQRLLESLGKLFGPMRGGLAVSVVIVGAVLAASTGIVGASVVMMSLIALPLMLKRGYDPRLASASIAASGTLGQIIPPSIVLIILGDQMHVSVGDLFKAAVAPGMILVGLYIVYILYVAWRDPRLAPPVQSNEKYVKVFWEAMGALWPPLTLIIVVLGSIFAGVASPTESAAVGAVGAIVLAWFSASLTYDTVRYAAIETVKLSAMIFMILIGATAFSLVFNELGGGEMAHRFFTQDLGEKWLFVLVAMTVIFLLGFFVDFIEIAFVVVPILVPIAASFGIDPVWFAILIALNLQASFLTPPFGFALFYLKGAAGTKVRTIDIYKGVIPFVLLQLITLAVVAFFPGVIRWV